MSWKVQRLNFSPWEFGVLALGKWGAALLWMDLVLLYSPFSYSGGHLVFFFSQGSMEEYFALIKLQIRAVAGAHLQSVVI